MSPTGPRRVYCENVDFYFLFEMLCVCLLQGVWGVDDAVAGADEERRCFSGVGRLWVMVLVSCSPWVLAAGEVLESCAGWGWVCGLGWF